MFNSDIPTRADLPSSKQLVRSTLIAIIAAAALLVTVVLPAEYGVDPTGIGSALGLKQMGEIKTQLAAEAALEVEQVTNADTVLTPSFSTVKVEPPADIVTESAIEDVWQNTVTLTLKPGEAAEIKLAMSKDDLAVYEWTTSQGHLNSDLHADGTGGEFTSYGKGRKEVSNTGELEALFDGTHGWFWRNRSEVDVEITLQIKGTYGEIKRVV